MAEKKDAEIVGMVREAHRLAHHALNKVHGNRLIEGPEIAGLAHALIAGRHVTAGSGIAIDHSHAGADAKGESLLEDAYGRGREKSSGNF